MPTPFQMSERNATDPVHVDACTRPSTRPRTRMRVKLWLVTLPTETSGFARFAAWQAEKRYRAREHDAEGWAREKKIMLDQLESLEQTATQQKDTIRALVHDHTAM